MMPHYFPWLKFRCILLPSLMLFNEVIPFPIQFFFYSHTFNLNIDPMQHSYLILFDKATLN